MTRAVPAALMLEDRGPDSLDAHVRRYLKDLGLWGYHTRMSTGSQRGWPDWTIVGSHAVIYRELKTESGTLSPYQREVGARLRQAGQDWAVWRPRDLYTGAILSELMAIA